MAIPIVKADLEKRLGAANVQRYARDGGDTFIAEMIAQAWDTARSAGTNIFTPESWDALTAETLPGEAKRHIVSDACDLISAGMDRPEFIGTKSEEARLWRSWLAGDTVRCFDAVLTRIESRSDGAGVTFQAPPRKFDRKLNDWLRIPRRERP